MVFEIESHEAQAGLDPLTKLRFPGGKIIGLCHQPWFNNASLPSPDILLHRLAASGAFLPFGIQGHREERLPHTHTESLGQYVIREVRRGTGW